MKKITLLMVCLFATFITQAQWNTDIAVNTLVANTGVDGDAQSVVGTNDYTYVVFWNKVPSPTNYELRIQVLDESGNRLLGDTGGLISNTIPMGSYTQIKSIVLDKSNNVYVGVTGTVGNAGRAFKLDSTGNNLWTSDGLDLGTAYLVRMLPLDSGDVMISTLNGDTSVGELQKYASDGTPIWATPATTGSVSANLYELANGDIVSVYHQRNYGIYSTMFAQRYSITDGSPVWDNPAQLFDNNMSTAYNATYFGVQDGDNIYYSFKLSHDSRFDVYVQRINPDGTLPWGTNGSAFDITETYFEQEVQIAHQPGTDHIWALSRFTNGSQSQTGTFLQKYDKVTGDRLLTNNGKEIYPVEQDGIVPSGHFLVANDQPTFLTPMGNSLHVNLLDANGDFVWSSETKPLATSNYPKGKVNFHELSNGELLSTFVENRDADGTTEAIYAQTFMDSALSINDEVISADFQFVNPITDVLEIKSSSSIEKVTVYTMLGQLVNKVEKNNSNQVSIDSQNWNPGLYLVHITTNNNQEQVIKIMKK